jgi:hypothetical protein
MATPKKWRPKTYKGPLNKPIFVDLSKMLEPTPSAAGNVHRLAIKKERAYRAEIKQQINEKIQLLFEQHGIDETHPDRWRALARALAFAHVRGFHLEFESPKLGRPQKPPFITYEIVRTIKAKVEELESKRGPDSSAATFKAAIEQVWKRFPEELGKKPKSADALERLYYTCLKRTGGYESVLERLMFGDFGDYKKAER